MNNQSKGKMRHKDIVFIGFIGGVFFSFIGYVEYLLNFTTIHPSFIWSLFTKSLWSKKIIGEWMAIIFIGLLSIPLSYGYYVTLAKIKAFRVGIIFGIGLWLFIFYVLYPLFPAIKPVSELSKNTIISTISLYILYGVFIGHSLSYLLQRQS